MHAAAVRASGHALRSPVLPPLLPAVLRLWQQVPILPHGVAVPKPPSPLPLPTFTSLGEPFCAAASSMCGRNWPHTDCHKSRAAHAADIRRCCCIHPIYYGSAWRDVHAALCVLAGGRPVRVKGWSSAKVRHLSRPPWRGGPARLCAGSPHKRGVRPQIGGLQVLAGDLEAALRLLCPQVLHVGRAIPVLSQLRSFLTATFPAEYEARAQEERPAAAGNAAEPPIPLFVMAVMLPGAQTGRPSQSSARRVAEGCRPVSAGVVWASEHAVHHRTLLSTCSFDTRCFRGLQQCSCSRSCSLYVCCVPCPGTPQHPSSLWCGSARVMRSHARGRRRADAAAHIRAAVSAPGAARNGGVAPAGHGCPRPRRCHCAHCQ